MSKESEEAARQERQRDLDRIRAEQQQAAERAAKEGPKKDN